jgi:hypothetical protein
MSAAAGGFERNVTGATSEIDDSSSLVEDGLTHESSLPGAIATERQEDSNEVVTIGDGRKEGANVALFALRRIECRAESGHA